MPDFEALIKQQQLKQPESEKRLKIVDSNQSNSKFNDVPIEVYQPKLVYYFFAGFSGSLIATIAILFLYENNWLTFNLVKLNEFIQSLN